jgi:hypothetical protein
MKVYITATPEFSSEILNEVALILNETPGELEFISEKLLTTPQCSLVNPKMNSIETIKNLSFDEFFDLCDKYRIYKEIPDYAYVVLVTSIKNYKDWFSAFNGKNIFVHGVEWEYYTKRDAKFGIAYQIVENIFQSQIGLNINDAGKDPNIHMDSIGCINDFCENKTDVMLKLRTADICDSCLKRAEENKINPLIFDHISRIIRNTREKFVNSSRIQSMVKPDKVYIDPDREVRIGNKEVGLDPLNKVLFIFFLKNLQGIETKLICEYKDDFYEIYKEVRDNPDNKSIEKLVDSSKRNFEVNRSRLNKALSKQLGPNLAEYYIIDCVEIKDDYNKYIINLKEEYITIEPSKRK